MSTGAAQRAEISGRTSDGVTLPVRDDDAGPEVVLLAGAPSGSWVFQL